MEELATSYILILCLSGIGLLLLGRLIELRMLRSRKEWVRLLIIVPQGLAAPLLKHSEKEIALSTELYKRLGELGIPFTLEAAVHALGEEIHFYMCVPRYGERRTIQLIETLWRSAYVHHADEYEVWLPDAPTTQEHITAGYLTLAKPYSLPLKVAHKGNFEPFSGVLRALSNLGSMGDGAAIQWVIKPADPRLMRDVGEHLNRLEKGEYHASRFIHEDFLVTPGATNALREKAHAPLFAVNCRIISARTHGNASFALDSITKAYVAGSLQGTQYNSFAVNNTRNPQKLITNFLNNTFEPAQEMILSAEELATYFHLPGPTTPFPRIKRR